MVRSICFAFFVLAVAGPAAGAGDQLADAQRLYNAGQYDAAEKSARDALRNPSTANGARLVLGRIQLERYRQSADAADLASGRESLRQVDAGSLDARDRIELAIGLGEALYFEDHVGAAAELFESVLNAASVLGDPARERVLDWWATSVDRLAQARAPADRVPVYDHLMNKMAQELAADPWSSAAGYWMAAAARGVGDLDRAFNAATAAWVRAPLAHDHGAALRADIDRLVTQAILPERAARLETGNRRQALSGMLNEWEAFKSSWSR
jgi:hypothetical protein